VLPRTAAFDFLGAPNMVDEQIASETPEEIKRRKRASYMRNYRRKDKPEEEITSFEQISEAWVRNDVWLLKQNPDLHARLLARHDEVMCLEVEAEEVAKGVRDGRRAETLSALTPDPENVMPMPDNSFRDIKKDSVGYGVANYQAIEAASIKGEPLDEISDYYKRFGFRLRLSHETLQNARENLVLYALRSKDTSLDATLVGEAIDDCAAYRGFSPSHEQLQRLIRHHRQMPELTQKELIARTLRDLHDAGSGALNL
jgi:hypothetical protein